MMPPHLTPEQKEQLKMCRRSSMRIEETWSLYTMFLSQDKLPTDALQLAVEAVAIWADWMDSNEIEPPEIEPPPDFATQMGEQMSKAFGVLKQQGMPIAQFLPHFMVAGEQVPNAAPSAPAEPSLTTETGSQSQKDPALPESIRTFLSDLITDIDLSLSNSSHQMSTMQAKGEALRLLDRLSQEGA